MSIRYVVDNADFGDRTEFVSFGDAMQAGREMCKAFRLQGKAAENFMNEYEDCIEEIQDQAVAE